MRLDGKVALVTGGSRGIGHAICRRLAQEGAKIVINYAGNAQAAQATKAEIEAMRGEAITIQADVSSPVEVEQMIQQTVDAYGKIDILVNNAGITRDNLLMRMKEEDWDRVLAINLKGVFNCTKSVVRLMMKQRFGRIINISSVVGQTGNIGQANYAAAKAGILGFTKAMAKELASRNITVNAIAPGFITTEMTESLNEEVKKSMLQIIPLGRFGKPEDVAEVVVFLASHAADYITGQTINVDGGMVM